MPSTPARTYPPCPHCGGYLCAHVAETAAAAARRHRLRRLVVACVLTLSLLYLATSDPIPAAGATGHDEFVAWYHADPANAAWYEWTVWMQVPANAAYFAWATRPAVVPVSSTRIGYGVWDRLAECESHGDWGYGPHSTWGSRIYEGGLQFHPTTWDAHRPAGYPSAAYRASREQQIVVGERVLVAQGWGAWPACSRKLGLR